MRISLCLLLLTLVGCGKEVNLDTSKLEQASQLTVPDQVGTLSRASGIDTISASGGTYKVSIYSSYNALEFIAKRPIPSSTSVRFRGKTQSSEIVLETLSAQ